jgi:hypothetical protein
MPVYAGICRDIRVSGLGFQMSVSVVAVADSGTSAAGAIRSGETSQLRVAGPARVVPGPGRATAAGNGRQI